MAHYFSPNSFEPKKTINKLILGVLAFLAPSSLVFGQITVVTVSGMGSITCPAAPTSTWTGVPPLPATVTFSQLSRGSGVTCVSASDGISGSGFNTASADASFSANKYYQFTITNAAGGTAFRFEQLVWLTAVSGTGSSCKFTVRIDNNGGGATDFGTPAQTNLTTNTFTGSVTIAPGTSATVYAIPHEADQVGRTVRFKNNSNTNLPVELYDFRAILNQVGIKITFTTASERSNAYFSIERAADGIQFREIGQVAGAGDSDTPQDYSFTDPLPLPGKNYYRLRQVDFDGKYTYSKVVSVNFGKTVGLTLSPMPASSELRVSLEKQHSEDGRWQVLDMRGCVLRSGIFPAEMTEYPLSSSDWPVGALVFRLVLGQEVLTQQFFKNN